MVVNNTVATKIPPYPSPSARKALSPSQIANLNRTILACIEDVLSLPSAKCNTPAAHNFVSTYARDAAVQTLEALIWSNGALSSKVEYAIRSKVLQLAEKLDKLDVQTLLDLVIVYAKTNLNRLRAVLELNSHSLATSELVSPFVLLLQFDNSPGLYALRKASHCISSLLHVAPSATLRTFAHSKAFVLALATIYHTGMNTVAQSYGGLNLTRSDEPDADDWEKLWLETKVSFMDSFHACMVCLLNGLASASAPNLAAEAEATFDIVFALLDSNPSAEQPQTPFLNRSILTDYQQSYDLMRTLSSSLQRAMERDARLELLEASLRELETQSGSTEVGVKNPGALRLLLRSSGVPPGIDNRGIGSGWSKENGKGRENKNGVSISTSAASVVSTSQSISKNDIDVKISQVLDIFPDQNTLYIRDLLLHPSYPFASNLDGAERVIGALLEGTAPSWDEVRNASKAAAAAQKLDSTLPVTERRNIFDEEEVDISKFRVGKKRFVTVLSTYMGDSCFLRHFSEDVQLLFRDRETVEQMKADILRRVEEFSSSEDGDEGKYIDTDDDPLAPTVANKIKIVGDGEDSDSSDSEGSHNYDSDQPAKLSPETILELAYIENVKLFDRDSATRGSKARKDLKEKTGWEDEQIEGWRIMLDRDVRSLFLLAIHCH